jgi:exonuclease SbcC
VILRKLSLTNFRQFRSAELEFLPGLTAIVGPNGSGKTTLVEAISWALYGEQRKTKDTIKHLWAEDGKVSVTLSFSIGNKIFEVARTESTASLKEVSDEGELRIAVGLTPVTKASEKLLNLTYEQFKNSFCAEQKQLEFMRFRDGDRAQEQLAKILNYDALRIAAKKSKDEASAAKLELTGIEETLEQTRDMEAQQEQAKASLQASAAALAERKTELAEATRALAELEPKKDLANEASRLHQAKATRRILGLQLKRTLEESESELLALSERKRERDSLAEGASEYAHLEATLKRLQEAKAAAQSRVELEKQLAEIKQQIDGIKAELEQLPSADVASLEKAAAERKIAKDHAEAAARTAEKAWNEQKAEVAQQIALAEQTLRGLESDLERVSAAERAGVCPECGQPLPDGHLPKADHLRDKIAKEKRTLAELEAKASSLAVDRDVEIAIEAAKAAAEASDAADEQLSDARLVAEKRDSKQQQAADLIARADAANSRLAGLPTSFDDRQLREVEENRERLRPAYNRFLELGDIEERIEVAEGKRTEAKARFEQEKAEQAADEARLKEIGLSEEQVVEVLQAYSNARDHEIRLKAQIEEGEKALAADRTKIEQLERTLAGIAKQKARAQELKDKELLHKELSSGFSELRKILNARMKPTLENYAGEILSQLTDGRYSRIVLDEKTYEPTIRDEGMDKKVISGGEQDIAALALRLGLARYVQEECSQPMSLLILDEVFGSLDPERRQNVLGKLYSLKGMFEQILIISHIESINEMADRCLLIRYDPATHESVIEEPNIELSLSGVL